jgi:hypothetical protein
MAKQTLRIIRAPHGYRTKDASTPYAGTDLVILPVEYFLSPIIKRHGVNSISNHQWRDSYWWMQQEAKRQLLAGTKIVIVSGEFPNHKMMMGFVKAARTYHAKLEIQTDPHPTLADEVPFDVGDSIYDRNSIVLSVHRFTSSYTIGELIELSKQQDQKGRG